MATSKNKDKEKDTTTPENEQNQITDVEATPATEVLPVYITIEQFLDTYAGKLNKSERRFYIGNHKTTDMRTLSDWEVLTGLKNNK